MAITEKVLEFPLRRAIDMASSCRESMVTLETITTFDQVILTNWLNTCPEAQNTNIEIDLDLELSEVYFSREDSEMTFEYIQLRDWLISIGCPLSLIWRLERVFVNFDFDYENSGKVCNDARWRCLEPMSARFRRGARALSSQGVSAL